MKRKWRLFILGYLFTNLTIDILNTMVDLLIPNFLIISIKLSFILNFSNIWPCWEASHKLLHLLLLMIFSMLLTASTVSSEVFAVFFDIFINCFIHHYWLFHFLQNSFLVFLILFFVSLVSKFFSWKYIKISKCTSSRC